MIKKRTKALSTLFVTLTVALLLTMSMPLAHACPTSQFVSGVFLPLGGGSLDITTISAKLQIWDVSAPMAWTGDISGTGTYVGRWYIYNPDSPDMKVYAVGVWTLSAMVDGEVGTLKIIGISVSTTSTTNGHWTIICGTGCLANLHGKGTYTEDFTSWPPVYPYTGQVYFGPK